MTGSVNSTAPWRGLRWLWPLLYMGCIYYLSSIPGVSSPDDTSRLFLLVPPDLQNLLHIPVFGGLAWLWHNALDKQRLPRPWIAAMAMLITAGYGVFDEWHQLHVPGRYFSLTDIAFNAVGAVIGVLLYRKWRQRRSPNTAAKAN